MWFHAAKFTLTWNFLSQGFYEEVASPLLSDVHFKYPESKVDSLTNSHFKQLFNGSEIVVAGQLVEYDLDNFLIEVSGQGVSRYCSSHLTTHAITSCIYVFCLDKIGEYIK